MQERGGVGRVRVELLRALGRFEVRRRVVCGVKGLAKGFASQSIFDGLCLSGFVYWVVGSCGAGIGFGRWV